MRARLLGLVLIPTLALTFFGGHGALERRQLADRADHLARDVDLSVTMLNTAIMASNEQRLTAAATSGRAYGVSIDQTSAILGFQVTETLLVVRGEVDRDPGLQEVLADRGGPAELARIRALADGGGDQAEVERYYGALSDATVQRWSTETEHLTTFSWETPQTPDLSRSIRNLEGAAALYQISTEQLGSSADLVLPGVTGKRGEERDIRLLSGLYDQMLQRLTVIHGDRVSAPFERLASYDTYDIALDRMLANHAAGGALDIAGLGETFRAGLARDELLRNLLAATAQDAHNEAVGVGERARTQYHRFLVAMIVLSLATVVLALRVASSIVRPLARLERRAVDLSHGRLTSDPLPLAGPREVVVVTQSINEAVATLGALEQKATALAAGDIGAALAARVPGELAELLDRSVHSLARSIQDRQELQQQLLHDATHDSLTGLLNRRGAIAALSTLLERPEGVVVVMFMDLDGFKQINDSLGHSFGDAVLTTTAERLTHIAPVPAVLARLGGDEFIVAASVAVPAEAQAFATSVIRGLAAPVSLGGHHHRVGVSAGVSIARPGDGTRELLRWADVALYRAKESGRDRFVVVDEGLRQEVAARSRIEHELRVAIQGDRLEVHYQQVTDARTGTLIGVEALVRWRLDDGSYRSPDEFIPVAEQSALIVDVDRWVLASAARQVSEWRRNGLPGLHLSVNASARTISASGFVSHVLATVGQSGLSPSALALEVTETVLINDLDGAATRLSALRDEGIRIAIDDFGTGYTSVAQLRSLPVDRLKIDRSFVARLDEQQEVSLVHLVIQIGQALGMEVVAEGVETERQLQILRELGCGVVQGFLHGRPLSAADFEQRHSCAAPAPGDLGVALV